MNGLFIQKKKTTRWNYVRKILLLSISINQCKLFRLPAGYKPGALIKTHALFDLNRRMLITTGTYATYITLSAICGNQSTRNLAAFRLLQSNLGTFQTSTFSSFAFDACLKVDDSKSFKDAAFIHTNPSGTKSGLMRSVRN